MQCEFKRRLNEPRCKSQASHEGLCNRHFEKKRNLEIEESRQKENNLILFYLRASKLRESILREAIAWRDERDIKNNL